MTAFGEMLKGAADGVEHFDCHASWQWVTANPEAPVAAVAAYLAMVAVGKLLIKERHGFQLRHLFALWNAVLSAFSTAGLVVCLPYLFLVLTHRTPEELICSDELMWGNGSIGGRPERPINSEHPLLELLFFSIDTIVHGDENEAPVLAASCYGHMGYFMTAFMLSKFPELLDTAFLLLMGKPVSFLQWYHHATVLAFSWFAYSIATPTAMLFGTMNYAIHSVMYAYFAVSTYTRYFSFLRIYITGLQLMQMFVGLFINLYTYYLVRIEQVVCSPSYSDTYFGACFALYASYFVLFAHLFYVNYIDPPKKSKKL
ncbi:putative fatty acid elongation protein 3 [Diplonema papillatum]|nr:putative fatty acid elongation protein 3 [Diplonema papillatum]|eukprot:gene18000-27719_t